MKVFISYSTVDRKMAASLYRDLRKAGAEAFQFGESETVGKPAWHQIIEWINECDAFVALISASSLGSIAVQEEIEMAHDCYMKSERTHPAKIVPAIIEARAIPPLLIRRMSYLDLVNYGTGLPKLLRQLGLKVVAPAAPSAAPILPAIDFDKLAREHARSNPRSAKQSTWREKAKQLLTAYDQLKPAGLPKETETQHVDSLLAPLVGKAPATFAEPGQIAAANAAFLGIERPETSRLSNQLLSFDRSKAKTALDPPTLRNEGSTLRWTPVLGATGYVVERSYGSASKLLPDAEAYRGTQTSYKVPAASHRFLAATFRVKATAGVFRQDSPWSNGIRFDALQRPNAPSPLALAVRPGPFATSVGWSPMAGATSYVLERSVPTTLGAPTLQQWEQLYVGPQTSFLDPGYTPKPGHLRLYRVKAVGPWGETAWVY